MFQRGLCALAGKLATTQCTLSFLFYKYKAITHAHTRGVASKRGADEGREEDETTTRDRPTDRPTDRRSERASERPTDRSTDRPTDSRLTESSTVWQSLHIEMREGALGKRREERERKIRREVKKMAARGELLTNQQGCFRYELRLGSAERCGFN